MTGKQWLKCNDPHALLVAADASDRKVRLFAVACCRQVLHLAPKRKSADALLDVAERFADGKATASVRKRAEKAANKSYMMIGYTLAEHCMPGDGFYAAMHAREFAGEKWEGSQADLARDVLGNPFRPVTFLPAWRTDTVLALAKAMYDSRDFAAMPILADALEDAGCTDKAVLAHCRGPGPHVRGCWCVDGLIRESQ